MKLDSGITDWKEDLQHFHNQLEREPVGNCDGLDFKQKKKENIKLKERLNAEANKKPDDMEDI